MKKIIKKTTNQHGIVRLFLLLILLCFTGSGCKKFIEVDAPITSVNGGNVYTDDANAIAAVTGIYAKMSNTGFSLNLSRSPELSADNLSLFTLSIANYPVYYQNALISNYAGGTTEFWSSTYSYIYAVNAAIEGIGKATTLTPALKQRLLGEAYFLRAFYYFYLVNFYGDVPLALTTDYSVNNSLNRTSFAAVYQQIVKDLLLAKSLLDDRYVDATLIKVTTERVRPNSMAVNALLSRVYLYMKNYTEAEASATAVIQSSLYSSSIPLSSVFLQNSMETIWSLQPVKAGFNTDEANFYVIQSDGPDDVRPVYLSSDFINAFESGDQRKTTWIGSVTVNSQSYPYPAKYKVVYGSDNVSEYPIVLRLAEQYLIRAEARAELNNVSGSQSDLNVIRNRAGLSNTSALTTADLRIAILKERRVELFAEWGNRWFDLRRTGQINTIMQTATIQKGGVWQPYKALYPIPLSEVLLNSKLTQNTGY